MKYFMLEVEDWTQPAQATTTQSGPSRDDRMHPKLTSRRSLGHQSSVPLTRPHGGVGGRSVSSPNPVPHPPRGVGTPFPSSSQSGDGTAEEPTDESETPGGVLSSSAIRRPLPKYADDGAGAPPIAPSLQALTRDLKSPGPFVPLLDPIQRSTSPAQRLLVGRRNSTLPIPSVSKVSVEGKGKQKEISIDGTTDDGMSSPMKQSSSQPPLSTSPLKLGDNRLLDTPSPASSTRSKVSATPLGVPFSGRRRVPGAFQQADTAGSSPNGPSHLRDQTTASSNTSPVKAKASATIAVTSDADVETNTITRARSREEDGRDVATSSAIYLLNGDGPTSGDVERQRTMSNGGGAASSRLTWASLASTWGATLTRRARTTSTLGAGGGGGDAGAVAALLRSASGKGTTPDRESDVH